MAGYIKGIFSHGSLTGLLTDQSLSLVCGSEVLCTSVYSLPCTLLTGPDGHCGSCVLSKKRADLHSLLMFITCSVNDHLLFLTPEVA